MFYGESLSVYDESLSVMYKPKSIILRHGLDECLGLEWLELRDMNSFLVSLKVNLHLPLSITFYINPETSP